MTPKYRAWVDGEGRRFNEKLTGADEDRIFNELITMIEDVYETYISDEFVELTGAIGGDPLRLRGYMKENGEIFIVEK